MNELFYESRKEQMQAFARRFKRGKASLAEVLKDACICGAAEERFRTLQLARNSYPALCDQIAKKSIEDVLGYSKPQKEKMRNESEN
ncbi:MAG TPA: hypothetical protein VE977_13830 [Pyrinomonadaceae bacterium]|nr:hypothetical protein [Pyrinomonadaceae bacterium]